MSVEVQQPPEFFLEPSNIEVYYGDWNGATFQCNASGWLFPGFTWHFKPKNSNGNFTIIPGEDENEYPLGSPKPEDEGFYFCSASNEQSTIQSRIVELIVLEASAVQLSQRFTISFALNANDNSLTDVNEESINSTTEFFIKMLHDSVDLQSASIENVETTAQGDELLMSFSLSSNNIPYPQTSLADVGQLAPQAFGE